MHSPNYSQVTDRIRDVSGVSFGNIARNYLKLLICGPGYEPAVGSSNLSGRAISSSRAMWSVRPGDHSVVSWSIAPTPTVRFQKS